MNSINAADREKNSLQNETEHHVNRCKSRSRSKSKRLQGQGIANQRRELQKVW
jgi:hypothetical protein